jgi:sigma-E factor negative regulatory protein RseA
MNLAMKDTMPGAAPRPLSEDDALSALLDGELPDAAARGLLRRLAGDPLERARYREYCAIGDTLRGLDHDLPDLTDRVMAALEAEPTVLAPVRKPANRHPALWLAAATVVAITWGLWSAGLHEEAPVSMAASQPGNEAGQVMPYLAAHQDFAQAVVSQPEMRFTRVTLAGAGQ